MFIGGSDWGTVDWFALLNKYLWGKIRRTSLKLTEIWPISDNFLEQKSIASLCITVQCAFPKIVSGKLSKQDSKLSDIWNYFLTMFDAKVNPRGHMKNNVKMQNLL